MNNKSWIRVFHEENTVKINKIFYKESQNPTSDEYKLLQEIRKDYPNITVKLRQIERNANKTTYAGLTYQYMRDYIVLHASSREEELKTMAEFEEMLLISRCQAKARRYPVIKRWFLEKYPEIVEFGIKARELEEEDYPDEDESEELAVA